jgi:hypothetical protein
MTGTPTSMKEVRKAQKSVWASKREQAQASALDRVKARAKEMSTPEAIATRDEAHKQNVAKGMTHRAARESRKVIASGGKPLPIKKVDVMADDDLPFD